MNICGMECADSMDETLISGGVLAEFEHYEPLSLPTVALEVVRWYNAVCTVLLSYIVQPPEMLAYIVPLCGGAMCKVHICGRAKSNFAFVQRPTLRSCRCVRTTIWVWVHAANLGLGTDL